MGSPVDSSAAGHVLARFSPPTNTPNCVGKLPSNPLHFPLGFTMANWHTLQTYCISSPGANCNCDGVSPGAIPKCFGGTTPGIPHWIWSSSHATKACQRWCRCGDGPQIVPPVTGMIEDAGSSTGSIGRVERLGA
ncbi:MAG: hypothetical protein M1830_001280 [Pleopsidium flavum]|nr:MAG: hypothetical protein M1830_001280 [Pleopsidium flavum]